jgi:hypothetical protein
VEKLDITYGALKDICIMMDHHTLETKKKKKTFEIPLTLSAMFFYNVGDIYQRSFRFVDFDIFWRDGG